MTDYRKTLVVEPEGVPPTGFDGYHSINIGASWSEAHDAVHVGSNIFVCGSNIVTGFILKLDLNLNIVASIEVRSADGYGNSGVQAAIFHASNGDLYTVGYSASPAYAGRISCIYRFDTDLNFLGKQDFFITGQSTTIETSLSLNLAEYNGRIYAPFVAWGVKDNAFLASVAFDMSDPQVHAQYSSSLQTSASILSNGAGNFVFSCQAGHILFNSSFVAQAASDLGGRNHSAVMLDNTNYVLSATNTSGLFGLGITVVDQSFVQQEALRISYGGHTYSERGTLSKLLDGRVLAPLASNATAMRLPVLQPVTINPIAPQKNIELYDPVGGAPGENMYFEKAIELSNGFVCAVGSWNPNGYTNTREAVVCTFKNDLDYTDGTLASCDANTGIHEISTGTASQSPSTSIPTQTTEIINAVDASTIQTSAITPTSVGPCAWSPP